MRKGFGGVNSNLCESRTFSGGIDSMRAVKQTLDRLGIE
jgi:hypothetical protein